MKGYLSIREISYMWGVSARRVNQYVTEGRIPGAERFGLPGLYRRMQRSRKILGEGTIL